MHNTQGDWVVQTKCLYAQVTDQDELNSHSLCPLDSAIPEAKRENIIVEKPYDQINDIAWPWTIQRWEETKDANGEPLVPIPELVQHEVRLQYTDDEETAMDGWNENTKSDKWNAIQTVLHELRLASITMDLPDNDITSDDSESIDAAVPYHQRWERNSYRSGPAFRWLADVFVLYLLGTPQGGVLNKVVIFAQLPGQGSYVNFFSPNPPCWYSFYLVSVCGSVDRLR